MTASYLTTDIVVIIVLVVVLVLIGVAAFFAHFYWTKIGVSEIWNTTKWSSMRSSFYRTMRRFSRASSGKLSSERPFSPTSPFSEDTDGSALPSPLRNKKSNVVTNPNVQSSTIAKTPSKTTNVRRNSNNQVQPISTIEYNNSARTNYGSKIGKSLENTKIENVHEYDDSSISNETRRF